MPAIHKLPIHETYLNLVRLGTKTVEGRVARAAYLAIHPGDWLHLESETDRVVCNVLSVQKFSSFKDMLETVSYQACIPTAKSLEEALTIYLSFPGYKDLEKELGVVAFRIQYEDRA